MSTIPQIFGVKTCTIPRMFRGEIYTERKIYDIDNYSERRILLIFYYFCTFVTKTMIYGYIRVSSDKQTVENQRFEIERFCKVNNLHIDGWIEETISGTKAYNKRQLGVLLRKVEKDDVIICSELSRLGRSLFMIMEILSICMKKECRVWTIKDNYRLGDDIQSKVLAFAFGLSAEIERNLISQRTKEALARKLRNIIYRATAMSAIIEQHNIIGAIEIINYIKQITFTT